MMILNKTNLSRILLLSFAFCQLSCSKDLTVPTKSCAEVIEDWAISSYEMPNVQKQNDLFFVDEQLGFSVGNTGTILRTTNGGQNWEILEHYYDIESGYVKDAITRAILKTVYFINDSIGFAAGCREEDRFDNMYTDAVFLKTIDGGNTWIKKYLDGVYEVNDVYFFDQEFGIGLFSVNIANNSHEAEVRVTHDGGEMWTKFDLPLYNIESYKFITSPNRVMFMTKDNTGKRLLWCSDDNGLSWQSKILPNLSCDEIYFIDDNLGFAACPYGDDVMVIYQTKDGGNTWMAINAPFGDWNTIHFKNEKEGFVINRVLEWEYGGGEGHQILKAFACYQTFDGGISWQKSVVSVDCNLGGPHFSASKNVLYISDCTLTKFENYH